jgi:YebC/PmpR family DNA-binding regulatory protein
MEAYGPGGVAILIEALTDNRNRTASELRSLINKNHGNPAGAGSVSYVFEKKGMIVLDASKASEEQVMEVVLDAGAEDIKQEGEQVFVWVATPAFEAVKHALQQAGLPITSSELTLVPTTTVPVTQAEQVKQLLHLMEVLEDHDDVQQVYANFDIPDALLAQASEA